MAHFNLVIADLVNQCHVSKMYSVTDRYFDARYFTRMAITSLNWSKNYDENFDKKKDYDKNFDKKNIMTKILTKKILWQKKIWCVKAAPHAACFNEKKVAMELLICASFVSLFFQLNLEIIASICRMNFSFYYRLSIRASLISRAGQAFLLLIRRLYQCKREWATGCTYVCVASSAADFHFTVN